MQAQGKSRTMGQHNSMVIGIRFSLPYIRTATRAETSDYNCILGCILFVLYTRYTASSHCVTAPAGIQQVYSRYTGIQVYRYTAGIQYTVSRPPLWPESAYCAHPNGSKMLSVLAQLLSRDGVANAQRGTFLPAPQIPLLAVSKSDPKSVSCAFHLPGRCCPSVTIFAGHLLGTAPRSHVRDHAVGGCSHRR